ncbi:MAG: PKD domain-containing protein, partial [Bacteroidota bacterium]|nr:PKD domain-containing protein [Bacteroidota bacterium]
GLIAGGSGNTPSFTATNTSGSPVTSTVTVTPTVSGCTGPAVTYTITVNPIPVITVNSVNICPTQTATLTAAGGTTYLWNTGSTANPLNVTPASTTTYTVTGTTAGCSSTAVATVTVGGSITVTVNSPTICNGQTATLTAVGGTSYTWSTGAAVNPITVSPTTTTSYTVTGNTSGCTGTAVATVTVNPNPTVTVPANIVVCNGGTVSGTAYSSTPAGATYTWTNSDPTIGIPASGSGDIAAFSAINSGSTPITSTITVTPTLSGCTGATSSYTITINPTPTVTVPATISVCNGATIAVPVYTSSPAGGSFTWTNSDPSIGLAASGSGTTPSFTAVNSGSSNVTATITVTPTVNGCTGTPSTYNIVIFPTPAAPLAPGTSICINMTATLNASGTGVSFDWYSAATGGTLLGTSATYTTPNLSASTNYFVNMTSADGCISPMTTVPVTIAPGLSVTASPDDTVCFGGNTTLSVIPNGPGFTYNWTPAGSLTGAGSFSPVASPAVTTTYTVQVTDAGGCTGFDSVIVYADPMINLSAIAAFDVTCNGACDGQTIVIPGGGSGTPYSFLWNTGFTGAAPTGLCPGTYTVTVTDGWGCSASNSATVTEPTPLTASLKSSQPASCNGACDGSATALGAGATPNYTYSWNTMPVQTTATATGLCEGSYICTVTDSLGCSTTITVNITEPSVVVIDPIASVIICTGGTTTLSANATGGNPGGYNYIWTPAGTGSTATVTVSPGTTTVYTVNASDVANGCSAVPVNVTVTVNPPLSATSGGTTAICPGSSATLSAAGANGNGGPYTYSWSPSAGLSNANIANPVASPGSTTVYTVTVTDGCSPAVTSTETVTVLPLPVVSFNSAITSGCAPVCVLFNNTSTTSGGAVATWMFNYGDGTPNDTAHAHCYTTPGSYTVGLTVTSTLGGCSSSLSQSNYITVYPDPVASFTTAPSASIINPEFDFVNTSSGGATYAWDFGDALSPLNNTSTLVNPSHTYSEVGPYCVNLTATSVNGCVNSTQVCLEVDPEFTFFVPNAFSPNGDGINDTFFGKGDFILEYEMFIYDRWGNMIFFTDELSKPWDGKANHGSEIAQQDTYVYLIKVTDGKGKKHKYIGSVTIVK